MSYITTTKSKTKVTVTERFYDAEGNLTKEVETVTETEPVDTYRQYQPYPYQPYWTSGGTFKVYGDGTAYLKNKAS